MVGPDRLDVWAGVSEPATAKWIKVLVFVLVFSLAIERNQPIAAISCASDDPQSGTYLGNDGYRHPCP
jgi:hypothetical protein